MSALSINIDNHNTHADVLGGCDYYVFIDIQYVFDHIIVGGCVYYVLTHMYVHT